MIPIATITIPSTNAVTFVDGSAAYTNTKLHISGANSFTATGHATVSGLATNETVVYHLTVYSGSRIVLNQDSSTQTFKIPTLSVTQKTVFNYTYLVSVHAGKTADGIYILAAKDGVTYQDAFTLDSYTPPTLTNLSAERYSIRPSDTGSSDILTADNSGEYVRFSFTLTPAVTTVTGNSWTLNVKATSGSGKTQTKNGAYTGTAGITKTNDTTIFPSASFTFDPKEDWTFTFTINDKVTGTSYSTQVSKAVSILNVESGGVAVGGFLSTGDALAANNLILGSGVTYESTEYMIHEYTLSEPFKLNQEYTLTIWGKLGAGKTGFDAYIGDGTHKFISVKQTVDGIYSATGTLASWSGGSAPANTSLLCIYVMPNTVTGVTSRIDRIKLEKGRVALPGWTLNPKDRAEVTPFSQPKRFETSDDCGAILRGGLWDGRGYRMDYVNNTQMIDITNTSFAPYSNTRMPMISRVGPIVFFEGGVKCTKTTAVIDTDGIVLCTLPGWARPRVEVSQLSQGYSANIYWLFVDTDGQVWIKRNQQAGSYTTIPANGQLTFSATWLAADAAPPLPSIS